MSETLTALVPVYGLWLIAIVTFLGCLAVPIPSSLLMIAGGAFAASGDISLLALFLSAFAGAIAGDQAGFALGRKGPIVLSRFKTTKGQRKILFDRAQDLSAKWGGIGVFLSRWLLSPLGPYVSFIAGATGMSWTIFSLYGTAGELIWVGIYTGLGFVFSNQVEMVADIAANVSGFLAAATLAILLGRLALRGSHKSDQVH
ncbi:MAG: DedA family protein [Paracoccaceae bacterium]